MISKMKAAIFVEPGRIVLDEKPIPDTDCEYPVKRGLTIGHEPRTPADSLAERISLCLKAKASPHRGAWNG